MIANPCEFVRAFRNNLVTTIARHAIYVEVLQRIVNCWSCVFFKVILCHNATCLALYSKRIKNSCYYVHRFVARVSVKQIFDESCFANRCDVNLVGQPAMDITMIDDVFQRNTWIDWLTVCIYGDGVQFLCQIINNLSCFF